jgi:hypothetical protein
MGVGSHLNQCSAKEGRVGKLRFIFGNYRRMWDARLRNVWTNIIANRHHGRDHRYIGCRVSPCSGLSLYSAPVTA